MRYSETKLRKIFFEKSYACECGSQDCETNHRLCYWCGEKYSEMSMRVELQTNVEVVFEM